MFNRRSTLKATKPLNRMSLRKIIELNSQVDVRIALCKRAGGTPRITTRTIRLNNGTEIELTTILCTNGYCEECKQFNSVLSPHEDPPRSRGGKVSLEQSTMLCYGCHKKKKGSPMWSKK